jgi:ABC-type multidrug transport system fused ATPase/permease subunit
MSSSTAMSERAAAGSFRDALRILLRVAGYFRVFKARIAAKIGFVTFEHTLRMLVLPWPLKIVVDHVVLGQPIDAEASGFPGYMAPLVLPLRDMTPTQIMSWMLVFGVVTVAFIGMTLNRASGGAGGSGGSAGAAAGAAGLANQTLTDGHDTATQTENAANRSESAMGGILGILEFKLHLRLSQSLNHLLRSLLANHIMSLPMTKLDDQRIGDSTYRVIYDSTSATAIFQEIVVGLYGGVLMVGLTLAVMLTSYGNAPEVIVVGFLVAPLTFLFSTPFAGLVRRRSRSSRSAGSTTTSNIEEGMFNVLAVQSLGGNKQESQRFSDASNESFKRFRGLVVSQLLLGGAGSLAFLLGQILFFVVMAGHVIDGTYTAGDYFVVLYYFFVLSAVCFSWGFLYAELQVHVAGMARVFSLLDTPAETTVEGVALPKIRQGLVMENAGLTYPDGRRALRSVSLEARVGEIVALVGPTGAGKTTLAYLVPALLQATEGKVSIDGVDLRNVSVESLRRQVSYVFQETQLFSDSILENIRYGNRSATFAEVEAVARTAGAHDFITALPDGYETNLGTVTSKLSVGQKQRISIARGLLRQSKILILDEPTSALDPETEAYLVDALHEAANDKLVIVIAHRLSTISHADRIYFLEAGEIRESGSHEELMAQPGGHYRRFVSLQAEGT